MSRKLYLALAFIAYPFVVVGFDKLIVFFGVPYATMEKISGIIIAPWALILLGGFLILRAKFFGWIIGPFLPWNWGKARQEDRAVTQQDIERFTR
jgi:hypothetical protein